MVCFLHFSFPPPPLSGASSSLQGEPGLGDTITLGLSELGDLEVTADIVHCNTALYAKPDATPDVSTVATQDKATVLASPLQTASEQDGPKEPDAGRQLPEVSESQARRATANHEDQAAISQSEADAAGLEPEEEDNKEGEVEGIALDSQTEETEPEAASAEEGEAAMTSEEEEEEEEEAAGVDSETEGLVDSQTEEEVAAASRAEESDVAEEENDRRRQQEEDEADEGEEEEKEEEEERDRDVQHKERRAHRSEGALVVPVAENEAMEPRKNPHIHTDILCKSYI